MNPDPWTSVVPDLGSGCASFDFVTCRLLCQLIEYVWYLAITVFVHVYLEDLLDFPETSNRKPWYFIRDN